MRGRMAAALAAAAMVGTLGGCGGSSTETPPSKPHAAPSHPGASPSRTPTAQPTIPALGHAYHATSLNDAGHKIAATIQAVSFDMRVQSSDEWRPSAGHDYAGLTVRVCITADPEHEGVEVSWAPWTMVYRDGTTLEPATATQMEIGPVLYPDGMVTPLGQCRKGVIPFAVRSGQRPAFAEYTTPNSPTQYRWRLAA